MNYRPLRLAPLWQPPQRGISPRRLAGFCAALGACDASGAGGNARATPENTYLPEPAKPAALFSRPRAPCKTWQFPCPYNPILPVS